MARSKGNFPQSLMGDVEALRVMQFSEDDIENIIASDHQDQLLFEFRIPASNNIDHYHVELVRTVNGYKMTCTCDAGRNGLHCKHRIGLLSGEKIICDGIKLEIMSQFQQEVSGSDLVNAINELNKLEIIATKANNNLKKAKKNIAKLMKG